MRRRKEILVALSVALLAGLCPTRGAQPEERHVVIVVWDGMRPDFVSQENTPTLWRLAQQGVFFADHHAVYPPATHVNGASIVTGLYPEHTGIIANYDYLPEVDAKKFVSTEQKNVIQKADELSHGNYLLAPTLPELVRAAGGRTVVAGSKDIALLLDRKIERDKKGQGVTLSDGESLPQNAAEIISAALGPFPPTKSPLEQDAWTTRALTDFLWKGSVPDFSLLWLGEPDLTQHATCPGAPEALQAIKSSDDQLAKILDALEKKNVLATTDVFVVSDHGFSTIERSVDLKKILNDAGFKAFTELGAEPKKGDIMLVGNGGSVLFYVIGHDPEVIHRLLKFLQQSDFAGVIFAGNGNEGVFDFGEAKIERKNGPDLIMSFRWDDQKNSVGVPGMIDGDWNRQAGKGTHATLSKFDMHNTLVAAGPDFRRGWRDEIPSGNTDLAPTIAEILGITLPHMDGRVLLEAMTKSETQERTPLSNVTIEANRSFEPGSGYWHQTLTISQVGSTVYFDEGNGSFSAKGKSETPEPTPQD